MTFIVSVFQFYRNSEQKQAKSNKSIFRHLEVLSISMTFDNGYGLRMVII